ncbi:sialidase family protein [Constantimarinum furrinae]|uniref:Exo-alpha-sialidase n=1 Tax=Constantimarinum furrinae TaxID=2562285 RepID=A0A7G8PVE2_9FLAO|nr:sialidase family protein [Constantimarinum furrinae]QNJ98308.1 hypothetical protein ALE3EI_1757 [Constantimarinum furrinae]
MRYLLILCILLTACKSDPKDSKEIKEEPTHHEMSEKKVSPIANPVKGNSSLPRLYSNGEALYMSWVTVKDSVSILHYSSYSAANKWDRPREIARGSDWFVNWADFPAIAENNGNILTNLLQKSADGTYTYDVKLNLFNPKESTFTDNWKKNFIAHNDGTKSEHGFVSILPYVEDGFFISWLDGRNTSGGGHGDHDKMESAGAMTLRAATVTSSGKIINAVELDDKVCDCCQTSAALTENGPIVVYRDRSNEEIRDISIVRLIDNKWSEPEPVGIDRWKIPGCPVNGPSVDALGSNVVVAWFTAVKGEGDVKVIFSEDNGATFGNAFTIDSGSATGRVDVVMLDDTEAAVLWMEPKGEDEVIQLMKINKHGYSQPPVTVSKTSADRAAGFPQLERVGDQLFLAWTVVGEEKDKTIKTASFRIDLL